MFDVIKIWNEVVNEALSGRINLKYIDLYDKSLNNEFLNILFTIDNRYDYPYISIKNETKFYEKLELYVEKALIIYEKELLEYDLHNKLKRIIALLIVNVDPYDLVNFEDYVDKRFNMLCENIFNHEDEHTYETNLLNSTLHISYPINSMSLESVYRCELVIDNNGDKFYLPNIYYGISFDKCYIYAIQSRKTNEENSFTKKINRLLYKINANTYDNYEAENIKDVTVSHIFALTIFLKELEKKGINKVEVVSYLPLRYENKIITEEIIASKTKDLKEREILKKKLEEEREKRQFNITNKFIRDFFRINYIFEDTKITNIPGENSLNLNLKIDLDKCNNIFLEDFLRLLDCKVK